MSVIIQTRGEAGGGVAAHLQCPFCGHFSKSHAHQLSHMAASHPASLDSVAVGRLGKIVMYQSTARLFHCSDCFFTSRDFTKLYKHLISKHCMDEREGGGREKTGEEMEEEEEGGKEGAKQKRSSETEEEEEGGKEGAKRKRSSETEEEEEGGKEGAKRKRSSETEEEEEGGKEGAKRKRSSETEEEEEGGKEGAKRKRSSETEEEEEGGKEGAKQKRSSEAEEEEEEGEGHDEDPAPQRAESVKVEAEGDESVLVFDGAGYRCLICNWRTLKKGPGINHVVRKHDIPRAYANQSVRRDADSALKQAQSGGAEEEEGTAGLSGEMLKEEIEATAKVVRFISNRFVCLICGWKTKLKGFAISHVVRSHDVERPYRCKDCKSSFFLPSRLQQHVSVAHRPGRYACPFCWFRSHFLGGFRRHCSRCNAREEGEEGAGGGGGGGGGAGEGEEEGNEEDVEEMKETRKRRRIVTVIKEEEDEEEED